MDNSLDKRLKRLRRSLILSFLVSGIIILILLFAVFTMKARMDKVADLMDSLADQSIQTSILVEDSISFSEPIEINQIVDVGIDMFLKTTVPYQTEIPVTKEMLVPIELGVSDEVKIDTTIQITDEVIINVNDSIPLNQKMRMFGPKGPKVKVVGFVPLKQDLTVNFDREIPIKTSVPFDIPVNDSIEFDLEMTVPIDLEIPVEIPIKSVAKIEFLHPFESSSTIPFSIEVPVDIPMGETDLAPIFRDLAKELRELTAPF